MLYFYFFFYLIIADKNSRFLRNNKHKLNHKSGNFKFIIKFKTIISL